MAERAAYIACTRHCRPSGGVSGRVRLPKYSAAGIAERRSRGGPRGRAGGTSALWCAGRGSGLSSRSARRRSTGGHGGLCRR